MTLHKPLKCLTDSVENPKHENILSQEISVLNAFQWPKTPCICKVILQWFSVVYQFLQRHTFGHLTTPQEERKNNNQCLVANNADQQSVCKLSSFL